MLKGVIAENGKNAIKEGAKLTVQYAKVRQIDKQRVAFYIGLSILESHTHNNPLGQLWVSVAFEVVYIRLIVQNKDPFGKKTMKRLNKYQLSTH